MVGCNVPVVQPLGNTKGEPVKAVGWQPLLVKLKLTPLNALQAGVVQQILIS